MKKYFSLFVFCTILMIGASSAWAQEVGHYQIFQGKYTHWDADNNTAVEKNEIFLLDTTNGNLQVYVSSSKGGKTTQYWAPALIDETNQSYTITTTTPAS